MSFTHFVTPNGSPTSFCSANEPCSLARAVSLIGPVNMRPGSLVLVQHGADGVYSQAALTFNGSGTAAEPIRFIGENGVRLTGTRARVSASQWARVPDREFTYRVAWDDAASFAVANVTPASSRDDVAADQVDDRLPPFTQSLGRPFSLEFPILYVARSSIAEVEAQHCTFWNDRQNDVVYVHMCHDGAPADADNVYLGSSRLGQRRHQRRLSDAREHRNRAGDRNGAEGQSVGHRDGAAERRGARRAGLARRRRHARRGSRCQSRHHAGRRRRYLL